MHFYEYSNLYQIQYFSITLKKTIRTPPNINLMTGD